jgi:DNA repair exonuclease SbcCD ATPase subunit
MKNNHSNRLLVFMGIAAVGLTTLAWKANQSGQSIQPAADTIPKSKKSAVAPSKENKKDFDKELDDLDRTMLNLRTMPDIDFGKVQADIDASMKKMDEQLSKHNLDMEKIQQQLQESLSKIDTKKMDAELKAAMKNLENVDLEKIQEELKASLSTIDEKRMKSDLQASLKELDKIDLEKMKKEIEHSLEQVKTKVDAEEISRKVRESLSKVDLDKVKGDMQKVRDEMEKNKDNMKLDFDKMRNDLEKTKVELKGYQEMVYKMEADGLLKTNSDYKIEYKDGQLFINGDKQSMEVTNKYKKYFPKDGITIRKEKGDMNINIQ